MTRRITITLTEDQAFYIYKVLLGYEGYIQNGRSVAFNKRLATKIGKELAPKFFGGKE